MALSRVVVGATIWVGVVVRAIVCRSRRWYERADRHEVVRSRKAVQVEATLEIRTVGVMVAVAGGSRRAIVSGTVVVAL